MKEFIKKYQTHFILLLLILLPILFNLLYKNQFSLNGFLHIPQFELKVNLYLYYLFAFMASILFYFVPKKWQWFWILLVSSVFLILWNMWFFVVMLAISINAYYFAVAMEKDQSEHNQKINLLLSIGISICIVSLLGFKYAGFITSYPYKIVLPLGISYYTFQAISYLLDVYSKKIEAERHFGYFLVYMIFFPKLFVGPIERYDHFISQIRNGITFDYDVFLYGVVRIFWGVFKKVVIVNRLAVIVKTVFSNYQALSGLELWIGAIFCGFYIYLDFSSFIDIAIGIGNLFGIKLSENFNHPYFSTSVVDFWRRWHITLSTWLRDYIFFPLNFSTRKINSDFVKYANILVTFLISGVWHGATLNFILWGGLHGAFQIIESLYKKLTNMVKARFNISIKLNKFSSIFVTFIVINISWIVFNFTSIADSIKYIIKMFSINMFFSYDVIDFGLEKIDFQITIVFVFALILIEVFEEVQNKNVVSILQNQNIIFRWIIYLLILFALIIFGYYGMNMVTIDPYYMQF